MMAALARKEVAYGAAIALFSFACFAGMQAFAKALSPAYNTVELIFWRHVLALIPLCAYVACRKNLGILHTRKPGWIALRSLVGTACLAAMFAANALQPLSQTTVLLFTSGFITPLLASAMLGEAVGRWRWVTIVVGYIGVMFMTGTPSGASMAGTLLGLTAALLQSCVGISLRYLGRSESAFTLTFYFILFGAAACAALMPFFGHWPALPDLPGLIGMALTGLGGQIAISEAYRYAPPAVVSPMSYSGLVWALILDLTI